MFYHEFQKEIENMGNSSERSDSSMGEESFPIVVQDDLLVKSMNILSKYKKKKLKILIANDELF